MNDTNVPEATAAERPSLFIAAGILLVVAANLLDLVVPPAGVPSAVLAIWLILKRTGGRWTDLGLARPESWPKTIALGIGLGVLLQMATTYGLGPLLQTPGAEEASGLFDGFVGNKQLLATYLTVSWTTAGFGEELIWRGFVLTRLAALFGGSKGAHGAAIVASALLFGVLHLRQGTSGIIATGFVALVFGVVFVATRRNLWLVFVAHGIMDTIAFLYLFMGWAG